MGHLELKKFQNDHDLARTTAALWLKKLEEWNSLQPYCVALSGGRITKQFFSEVVALVDGRCELFEPVHFFWADERCVPPTDPESNYILADQLLFQPLQIKAANIHRLRGELDQAEAVRQATAEIRRIAVKAADGKPQLDLIFLGMGEDGHVASLFPNASEQVKNCSEPFLSIDNSPKPPPKRLSMSFATISAAREVWALVSGKGKEQAFRESISEAGTTPLAVVVKRRSHTTVFSDLTE